MLKCGQKEGSNERDGFSSPQSRALSQVFSLQTLGELPMAQPGVPLDRGEAEAQHGQELAHVHSAGEWLELRPEPRAFCPQSLCS